MTHLSFSEHWPERQYRADLNGMRAVAVLSVVAFHLERTFLPGGFVGVDIFFVLSGFFITQLLIHDLDGQKFSILNFYDRRIRRLLPALFVMLAVTTLVSAMIMLPNDLKRYGVHLIGAVFSASNFVFWQADHYFAPASGTYPLLHTWSLAVEEQFYLVYPVFLWAMWRVMRKWLKLAMLAIFILSFALSAIAAHKAPSAAFYLAPSRAWELAGGALLALGVFRVPGDGVFRQIAYGIGLGMVGLSFFVLNEKMAFPGINALLPCVGTMFVIWAGLESGPELARDGFGIDKLLSWRPLVWVGLVSYSLYLWHWPVIVLGRYMSVGDLGPSMKLVLVPVMLGLAVLSWRYVERPFRTARHVWPTRNRRFAYSGVAGIFISGLGLTTVLAGGFPSRLPAPVIALEQVEQDFSPIREACHTVHYDPEKGRPWCRFGPDDGRPVYLYADSHGAELGYALSEHADELGLSFTSLTSSACPPVVGYRDQDNLNCDLNNKDTLARLKAAPAGIVILTAHYFRFAYEWPGFWDGFESTVKELQAAGHKVIILGPVPVDPDGPVPLALARTALHGADPDAYMFPVDAVKVRELTSSLTSLASRTGAEYVPLVDYVCGGVDHCYGIHEGAVIYFDEHHLSVTMAEEITDHVILGLLEPRN